MVSRFKSGQIKVSSRSPRPLTFCETSSLVFEHINPNLFYFLLSGACENCGAVTHKKRDCLERPRKIGAKFSQTNFAPDEFVQPNLSLSFDGKRDRWNGYDNFAHQEVVNNKPNLTLVNLT